MRRRARSWTKDAVVEHIRRYATARRALNAAAVRKYDGGLLFAATKLLGGWDAALEAAGLKPDQIRGNQQRTRKGILSDIAAHSAAGRPLNVAEVQRYDSALHFAAVKLFGTWDEALTASGFDPQRIRKTRSWSREKVVSQIQRYSDAGRPLNVSGVETYDSSLFQTGRDLFGSWDAALSAAGFDPAKVRKQRPWTADAVLLSIREMHNRGEDIASGAIQTSNRPLYLAALRYFRNWSSALADAGLDPRSVKKYQAWSREEISARLIKYSADASDLSATGAAAGAPELLQAARRAFGSWSAALSSVGVDPEVHRRDWGTQSRRGMIFENIIRKPLAEAQGWRTDFRFACPDGTWCYPDLFDPGDGAWIDLKIDSWGVSVDSTVEKYRPYAPSIVIIYAEGKRRASSGGVRFIHVDEYRLLARSATWRKLYSRIDELRAHPASIPIKLDALARRWTERAIIKRIGNYAAQGVSLGSRAAQLQDNGLFQAACRRFTSWDNALAAAGLEPLEHRKQRAWSRARVLSEVRELVAHSRNLSPGNAQIEHRPLYKAARRRFGSWDEALAAAGASPSEARVLQRWSVEKVLEAVRRLTVKGKCIGAGEAQKHHNPLYLAARRRFGSWDAAVEAANGREARAG